ncbi:MAG: endonuclease/exonuclease/phosphatase family protein [Flavobacteriales bacterium]|nr:MAG: endonuclease/exonuclease/phosphatase family protein [Flavobacteriales bacterium]
MRHFFALAPFVMLLPLMACGQAKKEYQAALVGFYNVENIYDTLDAPGVDDAEFLPGSAKQWGSQRYWRKLEKTAGVIAAMGKDLHPQGMAIVGLAEVENKRVVEDLVSREALKGRGYRVVHEDGPDRRGVDVALIYNPAIYKVYAHRSYRLHVADTAFRTRDQLLVSGVLDGDTTHVIVAHWPSRRGGEQRSAPKRKAAAELGRRIVDSLLAANADARILYMGDLNDDPVNASVTRFFGATGDRAKAVDGTFFNPMHEPYQKGIGSLAWRDSWNLFDQVLVSPGLVSGQGGRYRYYGARIYNEPYLRQTEGNFAGYPNRTFVGDTYQDGYSDHFPVFLILVKEV